MITVVAISCRDTGLLDKRQLKLKKKHIQQNLWNAYSLASSIPYIFGTRRRVETFYHLDPNHKHFAVSISLHQRARYSPLICKTPGPDKRMSPQSTRDHGLL